MIPPAGLSEGPLILSVTIWWEDAKVPTAQEKSPEGTIKFSLSTPARETKLIVTAYLGALMIKRQYTNLQGSKKQALNDCKCHITPKRGRCIPQLNPDSSEKS